MSGHPDPIISDPDSTGRDDAPSPSRRHFLLLSLGALLTGCASQQQMAGTVPGPVWRPRPAEPRPLPPARPRSPIDLPEPPAAQPATSGVLPRSHWAAGQPVPARMNRMSSIHTITVHHDGMTAFYETDERNTINRIESIRRFHRDNRGWGDIGYHYIIDRAGRIWEGRPLTYQGAHVSNHNPGNIGVMALGNFDQQTPSSRQLEALDAHLTTLMRAHRVPLSRIATHREFDSARTVCPGAALQAHMNSVRTGGRLG